MNPALPSDELQLLDSLPEHALRRRLHLLNHAGWSLSQLGSQLTPPRPKTTVHFWVQNAAPDPRADAIPVPAPDYHPLKVIKAPRVRTISPLIPPDQRAELTRLAQIAQKYRAKTSSTSDAAIANRELTRRALEYRAKGVPTQDIADAAGVSYRAMAKRLAKVAKSAL